MKCTFVKDLNDRQKLWKLDQPLKYPRFDETLTTLHVISSFNIKMSVGISGPETYIFPASAEGDIVNSSELHGSFRGDHDHEEAITGFEEHYS